MTLERLADDLDKTLKAVRTAEAKLNAQAQREVAAHAEKQDELKLKQEEFANQSEYVSGLSNELTAVTDELNAVKERMDARGSSMTDTSPLIKMKAAVARLREEAKQLETRIGVVMHTLVAQRLKAATESKPPVGPLGGIGEETYDDDDDLDD